MCFENFVSLILREVGLDACPFSIQLSILLNYGIADIQTVVEIPKDKYAAQFPSLVKRQIKRYPLVAHAIVHVSNMDLKRSSRFVNRETDKLLSLLPSSLIDNDFQILPNINVSSLSSAFNLKEKDMFASKNNYQSHFTTLL